MKIRAQPNVRRPFRPGWLMILGLTVWLVIIVDIAIVWHIVDAAEKRHFAEITAGLDHNVRFLLPHIVGLIRNHDLQALDRLCESEEDAGHFRRLTIIRPDGEVIADSMAFRNLAENLKDRPEVVAALESRAPRTVIRPSVYSEAPVLFYAVPVAIDGQSYIIRAAQNVEAFEKIMYNTRLKLALVGIAVAVSLACLFCYVFFKILLPLRRLRKTARRIASGELDHPLPGGRGEVGSLAVPLGELAEQLKAHYRRQQELRIERDAIFEALHEGIVLIDSGNVPVYCNQAARRLPGWDGKIDGRRFDQIVRDAELLALAARVHAGEEAEIELVRRRGNEPVHILVRGIPLREDAIRLSGVLLVFADITRLRKLEAFRRLFLADVSHEFRTPLTAIQAAAETLLEDNGEMTPEEVDRFLAIIDRHCRRLAILVNDIMALSKLEDHTFMTQEDFSCFDATELVYASAETCRPRLKPAQKLQIDLAEGPFPIFGDMLHLEQAVCNYIDNAVKYAGDDATITVRLRRDPAYVIIEVADDGPGIAPEHLEKIFERFYRVDKSRSMNSGGTGLGLTIVRHIALWHRGIAEAESVAGRGAVFILKLPLNAPK